MAGSPTAPSTTATACAADVLRPVVRAVLGTDAPPIEIELWDGSTLGGRGGDGADTGARIVVRSPRALRRLLYAPNELGFGRAYVAGELDVDGDAFAALSLRDLVASPDDRADLGLDLRGRLAVARAARQLGVLGPPLPPPPEEARLRGRRHSRERDAAAIAHHYDVGNDFYRLVLGPSMVYSCAYFTSEDASLEDAQVAKFDLVARKLALRPGMRLLDVGCGWGGMVIHAATAYGVDAVGVTVSKEQAELARKRAADAGVGDRIEIRVQDYRDVRDGPYDAISSIGMFEHVGLAQLGGYVERLASLLGPQGRLLNHGISRPPGKSAFDKHSFIERYVFPDGELHEVGNVVSVIQERGLEVRDVQSLREHYAMTLRSWVANLEAGWVDAVRLAGEARARVWRLYMAGAALNFEQGRTSIHQVLAVKPDGTGASGMPLVRSV
jgi:cyclopropane-fatty-acyl-phospholipid synthase